LKDTTRLKVYIDESSWTKIDLTFATTAEEICSYLNNKYKVSNEKDNGRRTLYLSLNTDPKNRPKNSFKTQTAKKDTCE